MRVLNLIGDASYSIYLIHLAVIGLVGKIVIKIAEYVPLLQELIFLLVLVGTVVGGCFAHLLIERPLIAIFRKGLAGKGQPSPAAQKAN